MNHTNNSFTYTYSAKEQKEIEAIRKKYLPEGKKSESSKIEQLRLIDKKVTSTATVLGLSLGIISTLIMGFGMSLIMTDLSKILSIQRPMLIGIIIGIIGMVGIFSAYPIYHKVLESKRKKVSGQIMALLNDISQ